MKDGVWTDVGRRQFIAALRYFMRYGVFLAVGLLLWLSAQNAQTFSPEMQTFFRQSVWQADSGHGSGSAFFISRHLLITNHHVANPRKDKISIRNHNRTLVFPVTVIKEDEATDLALLYCECGGYMAMTIPFGKYPEHGIEVYSAGYGLGKHLSFAWGHSQGVTRDLPDFPADYFSSVTTIMGDSGSPLLNRKMEIIGVRNAVESKVFKSQFGYTRVPESSHAIIIGSGTVLKFLQSGGDPT